MSLKNQYAGRGRSKGSRLGQRCKRDRTRVGSKKAVGRTLICPQSYVRRIDPIWVFGPVPRGFWHDQTNRRNYLVWLCTNSSFAGWRIFTG